MYNQGCKPEGREEVLGRSFGCNPYDLEGANGGRTRTSRGCLFALISKALPSLTTAKPRPPAIAAAPRSFGILPGSSA